MKNVNSEQKQGLEPVCVVGIKWDGYGEYFYADKFINGIYGRILQLSQVEETITEDGAGSASNLTIKLEDHDGTIKSFFDSVDLYLKPVSLYQSFDGASADLRVPIYAGMIVGPINWEESTRSISFSVTTRRTNSQVGFSYDETNTNVFQQTLIGKEWPMPFGTPIHYPALQLQEIPTGTTTIAFGIPDPTIPYQMAKLANQADEAMADFMKKRDLLFSTGLVNRTPMQDLFNAYWLGQYTDELRAAEANATQNNTEQLAKLAAEYREQCAWIHPHNVILGGYKFPQNQKLICKINEDLFICTFLGGDVLPSNPNAGCPVHIVPYFIADPSATLVAPPQGGYSYTITSPVKGSATAKNYYARQNGQTAPLPRDYPVFKSGFTWVSPGSTITLIDDFNFSFLASMIPGKVINVFAYKSYNGLKKLTQVPANYYTVGYQGPLTVITLRRPLSIISFLINQQTANAEDYLSAVGSEYNAFVPDHVVSSTDWDDQIYVTFQSDIGPNICDIIGWLVANYTPYTIDPVSFGHVYPLVANYPANFIVPAGRPLVDDLLGDIAYQSRCSLILRENVYYITYLPEFPTPVTNITLDDIVEDTLKITTEPIENLVTRYRGTWKPDYSPDYSDPNVVIVRANYIKYGYLDFERDFFIFNQYYLVNKAVLFWIIRKSQVYKLVSCDLFLTKLGLEVQDCVNLSLGGFLANNDVPGIVLDTTYNSDTNTVSVSFWTPVLMGTMTDDRFAFPMNLLETDYFSPVQPVTGGGSLTYNPGNIPTNANNGSSIPYTPAQNSVNWPPDDEDEPQMDSNGYVSGEQSPGDVGDPENESNQLNTWIPGYEGYDATSPPIFDSDFTTPKIETPANDVGIPSNPGDVGTSNLIGSVVSGTGNTYQVTLYPDGTQGDPGDTVQVSVPTIDPSETIPAGTWLNPISKFVLTTGNDDGGDDDGDDSTTTYYYECQVPIWLDSASEPVPSA